RTGRVAAGQRDEAQDVTVIDLQGEIAARLCEAEALSREALRLVEPAAMRCDQGDAAEAPRREDICALMGIALDRGPCRSLGSVEVAAGHLQPRQRHEVERIVATGTRLRLDQPLRHLDRTIDLVELAGEPVRDAVGAIVLPGPTVLG